MSTDFDSAAAAIVDAGKRLDARGWVMGGSGNFSMRLDDGTFAVTVSGRHKGHLRVEDIMRVDAAGGSMDGRRPSAETLIHTAIYSERPDANAVLHTHSVPGVVLTRLKQGAYGIAISGYEMLKALPGFDTHEDKAVLPIFDNDQDMERLADKIERALRANPRVPAVLLREHGLYAWNGSMEAALGSAEGCEYLLACELEILRAKGDAR